MISIDIMIENDADLSWQDALLVNDDQGWWFYDETGDVNGPFWNEADARDMLRRYCDWQNHGPAITYHAGQVLPGAA